MPRLQIMDTTIRDGQQSLWATRMQIGEMLPILPKMDKVGYWAIEAWGGATFDSCLRFLDENPWERLRSIKANTPNTPLSMLSRGQNLVGYKHYSREIVHRFINAAHRNGIEVFRVFDALNDIRNVVDNAEAIKACGAHFEGAISYTISPVHTLDSFLEYGQQLKDLGADSIAIKDMAGMLTPYRTERMVKAFNAEIGLPVHVHCHYVGGMAPANIIKAAESGAAIADTAHAPAGVRQLPSCGGDDRRRAAGEPLRHRARPRSALRDLRVLGGDAQARSLQARRLFAHAYEGVLPPGAGRHDEQPHEPARGSEGFRPTARGHGRDPEGSRRGGLSAAGHAAFRRSWAPRRCSTSSPASAGRSSRRR